MQAQHRVFELGNGFANPHHAQAASQFGRSRILAMTACKQREIGSLLQLARKLFRLAVIRYKNMTDKVLVAT